MREQIEARVTKKLSQESDMTKSQNLGALTKHDDFLLSPQVWVQSGTVPGTSRNMNVENHELTKDRSPNDPCPEVDASIYRSSQFMDSDPEETSYSNIDWKGTYSCIILKNHKTCSK